MPYGSVGAPPYVHVCKTPCVYTETARKQCLPLPCNPCSPIGGFEALVVSIGDRIGCHGYCLVVVVVIVVERRCGGRGSRHRGDGRGNCRGDGRDDSRRSRSQSTAANRWSTGPLICWPAGLLVT